MWLASSILLIPRTSVVGQETPVNPLKVLFIGNSYTAANDLPAMVAALADAAGGRKIGVDRHLVGGCTLEKHVRDQKAIDKSHPNATGTYLAACVFYATLLDANPVGLPGKILHGDKVLADIPDDQAKRLQEIAWAAVKGSPRGETTYTNPVGDTPIHMGDPFVNRCNEGAFVVKHDGRYYMTYSANHTGFPHYGIGYATADTPLGPWVKAEENPIAATNVDIGVSGPGHSCITKSPDGTEMFIDDQVDDYKARLDLYRSGKPYRDRLKAD